VAPLTSLRSQSGESLEKDTPSTALISNTNRRRLPTTIRRYLSEHRHSALLASIVIALEVRPLIGDNPTSHAFFSIAMVGMFVVALYTIQIDELAGERRALIAEKRRRSLVGWVLASLAIVERLVSIVTPSFAVYAVGIVCWISFVSFITWSELRAVLRQKEITSETISMSISVYLLLGLSWGLVYCFIYLLQPHAFSFPSSDTPHSAASSDFLASSGTVLIYFSLITLTTVGYGDITPATLQARYAAATEGVMGVFYLAILVARLVAMQLSGPPQRGDDQLPAMVDNDPKEFDD
jgi:voltage-gated potassium channel Kch